MLSWGVHGASDTTDVRQSLTLLTDALKILEILVKADIKGDATVKFPSRISDITLTYYYQQKQYRQTKLVYISVKLRELYPYSRFLWSAFSCIWTKYGETFRISPYSVQMRENTDQESSEYGFVSRSLTEIYLFCMEILSEYGHFSRIVDLGNLNFNLFLIWWIFMYIIGFAYNVLLLVASAQLRVVGWRGWNCLDVPIEIREPETKVRMGLFIPYMILCSKTS